MRRIALAVAATALAALPSVLAGAGEEKDGKGLPKPPSTPVPAFENPLFDAKVGETLFYEVHDLKATWKRYFEERVLARNEEKKKILVEVVETDATGKTVYQVDGQRSYWRDLRRTIPLAKGTSWKKDPKDEVLYLGEPPEKAVRAVHRYVDEPLDPIEPDKARRTRDIWFSHDVSATGIAKMHPAQKDGERVVISWDRKMPADECASRAERYPIPTPEDEKKAEPGMDDPGMSEPGMGEPGMDEPGMGEPGKDPGGMGA